MGKTQVFKERTIKMKQLKIGIIGAGMIGKLVIEMLAPYKLNVFVFDPFLPQAVADKLGVTMVDDLPTLFEKCHVISNHLANNPQTVGMINKSCFDRMMPSAVSVSRLPVGSSAIIT